MMRMTRETVAFTFAKVTSVSVLDAVEKERYLKDDNNIG